MMCMIGSGRESHFEEGSGKKAMGLPIADAAAYIHAKTFTS